jgi:hypothetical protein
MEQYIPKWAHNGRTRPGERGRPVDPSCWITGPCPIRRDKHYAWRKHLAQAKFRKESYSLSWADWESIWDDDTWSLRGRGADHLCLAQKIVGDGWHLNNVEVLTRRELLSSKRLRELERAK